MALILATLAVYRIATDLAWESGPGGAYERMRAFVMIHTGPASWIANGVVCPVCWSFWLSLIAAMFIDRGWIGFAYWFAIAGAVAFLARISGHDD